MARDIAIDRLRLWLTLAVVFGHALILFTDSRSVGHFDTHPVGQNIFEWLYSFHIPVFFMISGATYHGGKAVLTFICNKFRRLMVPYFLTFYFAMGPVLYIIGAWQWKDVTGIWFDHNARHLWFLYTLFWLSVAMRLLDGVGLSYGAILAISIGLYLAPLTPEMPWRFSQYFLFYVLGACCMRYGKFLARWWYIWFGAHVLLYGCMVHFSWQIPWLGGHWPSRLAVVGMSLSVWFILYALAKSFPLLKKGKLAQIAAYLYQGQYGLYLYHAPWIYLLGYYGAFGMLPWYGTVIVLFVVACLLAYATEVLVRSVVQGVSQKMNFSFPAR